MNKNLMIIGSGQLALMLVEESFKLKEYINKIYIYTDKNDTPCHYLDFNKFNYVDIILGKYDDKSKIEIIANKCDYITYEFESFNTKVFENENIKQKIFPNLDLLKIIQDKYEQKLFISKNIKSLNHLGFINVENYDDILNFIKIYSFPVILKSRFGAFDGRSNYLIKNEKDLEKFINIDPNTYFIEDFIDFEKEISIAGCIDSKKKQFVYYDVVKNIHKNCILVETIFPDKTLNQQVKLKVINILQDILDLFSTRGIICVELFLKDNEIYYNELCLRVHNSFHFTLHNNITSQFENHLRSILNINLGLTTNLFEGQFFNIISNLQELEDIKIEKTFVKLYNKKQYKIRKMGQVVHKNI